MSEAFQIIARGPRADAEAAAAALEADPATEALTFSILEEDEDRDIWRIDAFPNAPDEQDAIDAVLAGFPTLRVITEVLADADWLAMALAQRLDEGGQQDGVPEGGESDEDWTHGEGGLTCPLDSKHRMWRHFMTACEVL